MRGLRKGLEKYVSRHVGVDVCLCVLTCAHVTANQVCIYYSYV